MKTEFQIRFEGDRSVPYIAFDIFSKAVIVKSCFFFFFFVCVCVRVNSKNNI